MGSFKDYLGYEILEHAAGQLHVRFIPGPEHLNLRGVVHGGVLSGLLDCCLGAVGATEGRLAITLSLTTNFIAPASADVLECRAHLTGSGRKTFYAEGGVYSAQQVLLAQGVGVFRLTD